MRQVVQSVAVLAVSLALLTFLSPASGQTTDNSYRETPPGPGRSTASRTALRTSSVTVRTSPAYNPALHVPQSVATTTGVSPYQSSTYRSARARTEVAHLRSRDRTSASVAGYSRLARSSTPPRQRTDARHASPPATRRPAWITTMGTARYLAAIQANLVATNNLVGSTTASLGGLYANDAYVSGRCYNTPGRLPRAAITGMPVKPFDNLYLPEPGADVYHRYWPPLLDRDIDGRYLLDDADIYYLTQDEYYGY